MELVGSTSADANTTRSASGIEAACVVERAESARR
jgi:hypothetical protein